MKNKYALTIADIQLDVLSEAPQKEVDKISGIVDRKMREIYLNSRSCTRNEAALLCALEFCAERLANQDRLAELEQLTAKYDEVLKVFRAKNQELNDEMGKLRSENELLRSLLTDKEKGRCAAGGACAGGCQAGFRQGIPAAGCRCAVRRQRERNSRAHPRHRRAGGSRRIPRAPQDRRNVRPAFL
ncbi:MAG: cell division protein ZapA [Oscillospiraceae bacterium]|nr:MAG: cell division protein ZapA [Oscillospiraceae bacterium]